MSVVYIISQVMAGLGIVLALISALMKTKTLMLGFLLSSSVCDIISYALLGSGLSVLVYMFTLVWTIWYYVLTYKNKPSKYFYLPMSVILIGFYVVFPFIYETPLDIILLFSMTITTFILANRDLLVIRIGLIISNALWFAYDMYLMSYVMMVADASYMMAYSLAIVLFNVVPFIRAKKSSNGSVADAIRKMKKLRGLIKVSPEKQNIPIKR